MIVARHMFAAGIIRYSISSTSLFLYFLRGAFTRITCATMLKGQINHGRDKKSLDGSFAGDGLRK